MPKASPAISEERRGRYLNRLGTFLDCTYAVVVVLVVAELPSPAVLDWDGRGPAALFRDYGNHYLVSAFGLVFVITYWAQSVRVLGALRHSDGRHAVLTLTQTVFLLLYLFGVALGVDFDLHAITLYIQSGALVCMGAVALLAWRYACKERRLLLDDVTPEEIRSIRVDMAAEPITAGLTLLAAPWGATAWNLAWLSYPLVMIALNRRGRRG